MSAEPKSVWIVGESDDHIEAAFTTLEAAEAYLAKLRERDGAQPREWKGETYYDDHWWIEVVEVDPEKPRARDPLQGLGGLGA